jgi:hypothetical protein
VIENPEPRPDDAVKRPPCPVCEGAGRWDWFTGHPVFTDPGFGGKLMVCPFCNGKKVYPERTDRLP